MLGKLLMNTALKAGCALIEESRVP